MLAVGAGPEGLVSIASLDDARICEIVVDG